MITRFIAIAKIVFQYLQAQQLFAGPKKSSKQSEAIMIKEVLNETTAAIELQLHKLYFKMALGLTAIGILTYSVVRLIWYFENYLLLSYGQNFAIWFVVGMVATLILAMAYGKYLLDNLSKEKKMQKNEKAEYESAIEAADPGFFATPEKIIHQAFLGFLEGLRNSKHRHQIDLVQLEHLRSAGH